MPYEWTKSADTTRLSAWPYRSLPKKGFAIVIGLAFGLIALPLIAVLGTIFLWGLLPFAMLAVAALWWSLQSSYRQGELLEELTITSDQLTLIRNHPKEPLKEFNANPYWTSVQMHQTGGPVPFYVTLKSKDREVEIGAFLSEDERRALYGELSDLLCDAS